MALTLLFFPNQSRSRTTRLGLPHFVPHFGPHFYLECGKHDSIDVQQGKCYSDELIDLMLFRLELNPYLVMKPFFVICFCFNKTTFIGNNECLLRDLTMSASLTLMFSTISNGDAWTQSIDQSGRHRDTVSTLWIWEGSTHVCAFAWCRNGFFCWSTLHFGFIT